MKHLLSVNSYHYRRGGAEAVYLEHARLFEENGWKNTFFSMHHPLNVESDDSKNFARITDGEYAHGPVNKLRVAAATIYNFEAKRKANELIKKQSFDLVHAHCVYHHLTPAIFEAFASAGLPIVLTAHDLKLVCPAYRMMNSKGICEDCKGGRFYRTIGNRCIKGSIAASAIVALEAYLHRAIGSYEKFVSRVIAPSKFYRDKLVEWGTPAEKISYVPNFTQLIDPQHTQDHHGNLLYFGRLSDEKGLHTLIRAAADSGVAVDIAGSGPIEDSLKQAANELAAPVNFLGRLDGPTLWRQVGRARAVIVPSEWYENAPMSVLESFQLARPIIGADIGGIPELICSDIGEAGFLFAPGDVDGLSQTLRNVSALSQAELQALGEAGRELALSRFSREHYFENVKNIYCDLMR